MFLRGTPRADVAAIISIRGACEFGVEADVAHRLDLAFDDVEVVAPGFPDKTLCSRKSDTQTSPDSG